MKARTWSLFVLTLTLCLVLAACSSNDSSPPASTTGPAPVEPSAVADADEPTPAGEVETPEETPALGTVEEPQPSDPGLPLEVDVDVEINLAPEGIFAGATAALEALESYRFATSFLFTGEEDGEIESGSIELSGEIMGPDRKHFVWRDLDEDEGFEIIQLEDDAWIYDDGEWESVPLLVADAMSQAVLVFAPSVVWGGLFGGLETQSTYVGSETIDGVLAHHYTSTYQQWAGYWQGEVLDATGDVWIAEAGYPIRYDFAATGIDEDDSRVSISWTMELTDVGGDIVIEPPNDAPAQPGQDLTMRNLEGTYSGTQNDVSMTLTIYDADEDTAYAVLSSTNAGQSSCVVMLAGETVILVFPDLSELRLQANGTTSMTFVDTGVTLRRR